MKQTKDQYYTPKILAEKYAKKLVDLCGTEATYLEPSAGTGVFVDALKGRNVKNIVAFDLEEKKLHEDVIPCVNFFDVKEEDIKGATVVIGNPPFGYGGSLAVDFMNHCGKIGIKTIGFINPASVGHKFATLKKLDKHWHLRKEDEEFLPEDIHFVLRDGSEYSEKENAVRCLFQIWEWKENELREDPNPTESEDWEDVTPPLNKKEDDKGRMREQKVTVDCDFVIISHGTKAGCVEDYKPNTQKANVRRFIKVKEGKDKAAVRERFEKMDPSSITNYTTLRHNPSISPMELVHLYETSNQS